MYKIISINRHSTNFICLIKTWLTSFFLKIKFFLKIIFFVFLTGPGRRGQSRRPHPPEVRQEQNEAGRLRGSDLLKNQNRV